MHKVLARFFLHLGRPYFYGRPTEPVGPHAQPRRGMVPCGVAAGPPWAAPLGRAAPTPSAPNPLRQSWWRGDLGIGSARIQCPKAKFLKLTPPEDGLGVGLK